MRPSWNVSPVTNQNKMVILRHDSNAIHYRSCMHLLKRLLRLLFTIYAAILFGTSFLLVIPCYFLTFNLCSKSRAPHIAHRVSQVWAKGLYLLLFIRVRIRHKEYIDAGQTYVFVSNHRSFLDIPLFALSCSNTFRFLSKAELAKIPVLGYIIRNLYITVNRSDRTDRSLSIKKMKLSLDENISVFLCPEGTRNQTSEPLLPFKDGAFRLAIESGKPLAVLTVFNSHHLLDPVRWFELAPGIIHAAWCKPIATVHLRDTDLEMLKTRVRDTMLEAMEVYNKF